MRSVPHMFLSYYVGVRSALRYVGPVTDPAYSLDVDAHVPRLQPFLQPNPDRQPLAATLATLRGCAVFQAACATNVLVCGDFGLVPRGKDEQKFHVLLVKFTVDQGWQIYHPKQHCSSASLWARVLTVVLNALSLNYRYRDTFAGLPVVAAPTIITALET
ncbi:hypothetical protein FN846DRAFT_906791 [Sphaerosporella brunnea]|uniref:Uncharacterized protein n=1 Tax=Sphaerosporella brunnea TaxID=1250544 RepID=A0A5J5EXK0_9PEZI|nr:hypothetical protein FN846DRAFT_906791 [Sphaerosporella brunnea]